MQTFLPAGYSFSPNKLLDSHLYAHLLDPEVHTNTEPIWLAWGVVIFLICIGNSLIYEQVTESNKFKQKKHIYQFISKCVLWLPSIILVFLSGYYIETRFSSDATNDLHDQYNEASFHYPAKSNLNVRMLTQQPKPKTTKDTKLYPYRLYVNNDDTNIYLGKMKRNQFIPAKNGAATVFYKYNTYIMNHHLNDKFAKKLIFKKDPRYLATDGRTQWILTNDTDFVLHINDKLVVKQSKINDTENN